MNVMTVTILTMMAAAAAIYLNFERVRRVALAASIGYADWMRQELDRQFVDISANKAMLTIGGATVAGLVAGYAAYPSLITAVLLGLIGWYLPRAVVKRKAKKRKEAFNTQLVDALVLMSNALRSGLSLLQSFRIVVSEMDPPLSDEFALVLKEQRVSAQLHEALLHLNERIGSEDLDMVVTSIITLRETGGNLAETFDTVTHTIRERKKVEDKIKSLTAQGFLQGVFACLSPIAFVILMYLLQPAIMKPLLTTPLGWLLMGAAAILDIIGFFVLKRIVTIRV